MLLRRGILISSSFALLVVLAVAGTAGAQPFAMSGQWYMNRGPLVDIPINGGPTLCFDANGLADHNGCHDIGAVGFRPANGGIPGAASAISPMGASPASFTVPPMVFAQNLGKQVVAVPVALPTVLQLATDFNLMGPITACPTGVGPPNFGCPAAQIPDTREFRANAWTMQVGRAAANFSYCPGAPGNPACTDPRPTVNGATGNFNGRVVYTGGANGFGGTMAMTITSTGGQSHVSVATGSALSMVLHNPVAGMGSQAQGRGYAISDTAYLPPGPVHSTFTVPTPCPGPFTLVPPNCGQIGAQGAQTNVGLADTNTNVGFPWTTGTVTAQNIETLLGNPGTTTITGMGEDDRAGNGAGTITMVSGGVSHRVVSNQHFASIDAVTMSFGDKTPSMSPTGFAVAAVLMVLAVGYAFRRRL
jgi:hypothetical protein